METLLLALIVLACPLMMLLMMRGHGVHSHHAQTPTSSAELRRRRDELDRQIAERERDEFAR
jgi:hypothetical protein